MEEEVEDILEILEESEIEYESEKGDELVVEKKITIIPNDVHDFYLKEEELENKISINSVLLEKLKIDLIDSKLKFATNKMIVQNVDNLNKNKFNTNFSTSQFFIFLFF